MQDMTGSAIEVEVAGRSVKTKPLTIRALGEFVQWVRGQVVRAGAEGARGLTAPEDAALRKSITDSAIETASRVKLGDQIVEGYAESVEGVLRLLYAGTVTVDGKAPPDFDAFSRIVSTDIEGVRKAVTAIVTATPFLTGAGSGPGAGSTSE